MRIALVMLNQNYGGIQQAFELCPKVVRGELEKKAAYLV